jgi:hypothetical protein
MTKQATLLLVSTLLAGTAITPAVSAQDKSAESDQVMAVYDRYRPDYSAPGIRTGSFLFYPTIEAGGRYDSNIYAEESNVTDDFVAVLKPSFNLVSNWNSDYFRLFSNAEIAKYADNGSEDYEDFKIGAQGRKDISHGTSISAEFSYQDGHEDRGSPDNVGSQVEPTTFSVLTAKAGFLRDVSVLSVKADFSYEKRDFDDIALNGGGVFNNDDRDRDRMRGDLRLGYELASGYEAFVRGTVDRVEYDDSKEDGGPQRNSDGLEVVGGAAFDLTGKAKGEVFVGYMKRAYDSDTMGEIDGINFGAQLPWNVTGLTSFTGGIRRSIDETTVGGDNAVGDFTQASGIVSTNFNARIEHELRRNILLNVNGSYTKQDFELTIREDDLISFGAGAKYLINRNLSTGVRYDYKYRDTTQQGQDYSRHAVMVNVTAQW